MRVHILDPQLGRGSGHPREYDGVVADEFASRGIETILYGARDDALSAGDFVPAFTQTMWDHWGADPVVWALEDFEEGNARMLADLDALDGKRFDAADIAFFPNLGPNQIDAIRQWVMGLPEPNRPVLVLKLSYLMHQMPYLQERANSGMIALLYRHSLRKLVSAHGQTIVCTDAEEMAAEFGKIAGLEIPVLPLPLALTDVGESHPHASAKLPLCVTFLGNASHHKGFHLLPAIIAQFQDASVARFVVQYHRDDIMFAETVAELRKIAQVTLLEDHLDRADYISCVRDADIILMPYSQAFYGWASSGILAEALSAAKVVVVPDKTWLARQVKEFKTGGAVFPIQSAPAIVGALRTAIKDFAHRSQQAIAAAPIWRKRHSPENFVAQFLALAKPLARGPKPRAL